LTLWGSRRAAASGIARNCIHRVVEKYGLEVDRG
jgi:hypothetical protein